MKKQTIILIALLTFAALVLSGCTSTSSVNNSVNWPGMASEEDVVYFSGGNRVEAVKDGEAVWQYPAESSNRVQFYAAVAFDDSNVYAGTYSNQLHIFSKEDATPIRTIELENSKNKIIAAPVLTDDHVIVLSSGGAVTAFASSDFEQKWQTALSGELWVKPVFDNGKLYIASMDKKMNILDAFTGEILQVIEISGAVMSDPVLCEGKLYFSTLAKDVVELDPETSEPKVLLTTDGEIWASPLIIEDRLIAADMSGNVYCISLEDGSQLWKVDAVSEENIGFISSPVELQDGSILVVSEKGDLMLYDLDGKSINTRTTGSPVMSSIVPVGENSFAIAPLNADSPLKTFTSALKEDWVYVPPVEEKNKDKKDKDAEEAVEEAEAPAEETEGN